jgi:hypothetical protein
MFTLNPAQTIIVPGAGVIPRPVRFDSGGCQGWTGPLGPLSRRSDCMMANVVV